MPHRLAEQARYFETEVVSQRAQRFADLNDSMGSGRISRLASQLLN